MKSRFDCREDHIAFVLRSELFATTFVVTCKQIMSCADSSVSIVKRLSSVFVRLAAQSFRCIIQTGSSVESRCFATVRNGTDGGGQIRLPHRCSNRRFKHNKSKFNHHTDDDDDDDDDHSEKEHGTK